MLGVAFLAPFKGNGKKESYLKLLAMYQILKQLLFIDNKDLNS